MNVSLLKINFANDFGCLKIYFDATHVEEDSVARSLSNLDAEKNCFWHIDHSAHCKTAHTSLLSTRCAAKCCLSLFGSRATLEKLSAQSVVKSICGEAAEQQWQTAIAANVFEKAVIRRMSVKLNVRQWPMAVDENIENEAAHMAAFSLAVRKQKKRRFVYDLSVWSGRQCAYVVCALRDQSAANVALSGAVYAEYERRMMSGVLRQQKSYHTPLLMRIEAVVVRDANIVNADCDALPTVLYRGAFGQANDQNDELIGDLARFSEFLFMNQGPRTAPQKLAKPSPQRKPSKRPQNVNRRNLAVASAVTKKRAVYRPSNGENKRKIVDHKFLSSITSRSLSQRSLLAEHGLGGRRDSGEESESTSSSSDSSSPVADDERMSMLLRASRSSSSSTNSAKMTPDFATPSPLQVPTPRPMPLLSPPLHSTWQVLEINDTLLWRQREQMAIAELYSEQCAGLAFESDAYAVSALICTTRRHDLKKRLRARVECGNAIVERLLFAPQLPPLAATRDGSSVPLLAAVRAWRRVQVKLASALSDMAASGVSLQAIENNDGWQSTPLAEPLLRVGHRGGWTDVACSAVLKWRDIELEPLSREKNVQYYVLCPNSTYLREQTGAFTRELSTVYQASRLGSHEPAKDSVAGVFDVALCESRIDYVRAVRKACDELASSLVRKGAVHVNTCTVVYVVDLFGGEGSMPPERFDDDSSSETSQVSDGEDSGGNLEIDCPTPARERACSGPNSPDNPERKIVGDEERAVRPLLCDALTALLVENERQPAHNLTTVLLPLADIVHLTNARVALQDWAFGVYSAARRVVPTKSNPKRRSWEPRIAIAGTDGRRKTIHCCYVSLSKDQLIVCVTDDCGAIFESEMVYTTGSVPLFQRVLKAVIDMCGGVSATTGYDLVVCVLVDDSEIACEHEAWQQTLSGSESLQAAFVDISIVAMTIEREPLLYCSSADGGDCDNKVVFLSDQTALMVQKLSEQHAWPTIHRVRLLHTSQDNVRERLGEVCQQFSDLSWLTITQRCGGRQSALPLHMKVAQKLARDSCNHQSACL